MKTGLFLTRAALSAFLLGLCLLAVGQAEAFAAHEGPKPAKKAILLVAFGTSLSSAEAAYANIEKLARQEFPGVELRFAYTSDIIRRKVAAESGKHLDTPAEALAKLQAEDYTQVAVQSLQVIPGEEYEGLARTVAAFAQLPKGFDKLLLGEPLLYSTGDLQAVSQALLDSAPKQRKPDEALVFFGHGTRHPANVYYPGLQYFLWKKDKLAFVGTVDGAPTLDDLLAELAARKVNKVYLIPLMSVAGDHAHNDMAGKQADSWVSRLAKQGIEALAVQKGAGENDALAKIWVEHLKKIFLQL